MEELVRILPRLLELLEEPDRELYGSVLAVLARLGPGAAAALPQVRTMLRRGDPLGRAAAALALARIRNEPAKAVRALWRTRPLPVLGESIVAEGYVPAVQAAVAATLRELGPAAIEPLADFLGGESMAEVAFAAWGLGQVGPLPPEARARLAGALRHPSPLVRFLAAVAPRQVDGPRDPAVPVWLEMLGRRPSPGHHPGDVDECLGIATADILLEIGAPLAPAVVAALRHDDLARPRVFVTWLGELAAAHPEVEDQLRREREAATGPARAGFDAALKRHAEAVAARHRQEQRTVSFPPPLDDGAGPPDPVDAALDEFWPWLAEVTREKTAPPGAAPARPGIILQARG